MPLPRGRDTTAEKTPAVPPEMRDRLHGWRHPSILTAAALSLMAGFSQFSVTTSLPDVARAFGAAPVQGGSIAAQAGLSATTLGIGLAIVRCASLWALPLSGLADRLGRRRVVTICAALGLAITATAAASTGYWWFIAIVALGRPMLSATNAIAGVIAAEETRTRDRAGAIALTIAGYGTGAGLSALLRGAIGEALGFRELFALCLVPLLTLPLLVRFLEEPARFDRRHDTAPQRMVLSRIPRRGMLGSRFRIVALLYFVIAFLTGPVNTFLFLYGENVLGMARSATAVAALAAGPFGLVGLLAGRAMADRLGRLPSGMIAQVLMAVAGVAVYTGTTAGVIGGYLATILFASAYGPAAGAIAAELFPTSIRATVAGALSAMTVLGAVTGLVAFGVLVDALGSFGLAALAIAVPVAASAPLFRLLPETRDLELEESAPE